MSSHYAEANKVHIKEAFDYAKGRATSIGLTALIQENKEDAGKKSAGILAKTKMMAGQIMQRLFSHRKM